MLRLTPMLRTRIVVALACLASGCAARGDRYFVRIAEGLTSPTLGEGIRVAPRMFSVPTLMDACKLVVPVDRLEVEPDTLQLTVGNRYELNTLTVIAVDGRDVAVPAQPIVLEVEETDPPVVQLRSDDPDLNVGRLLAIGTGTFRMRVRTICGRSALEKEIQGRVGP